MGEELRKEFKKDGHEGWHLIATVVVTCHLTVTGVVGIKEVETSEKPKKGVLTCFAIILPIIALCTHDGDSSGDGSGGAGGDVVGAGASGMSGDVLVSLL